MSISMTTIMIMIMILIIIMIDNNFGTLTITTTALKSTSSNLIKKEGVLNSHGANQCIPRVGPIVIENFTSK